MALLTKQEIIQALERLGDLAHWRDDVDIEDARQLLQSLNGDAEQIWTEVEPFLVPGSELKARYAFLDLWEMIYGSD